MIDNNCCCKLRDKIEQKKMEMMNFYAMEGHRFSENLVQISQELDLLILEYQKNQLDSLK